jgi:hypothetical protein
MGGAVFGAAVVGAFFAVVFCVVVVCCADKGAMANPKATTAALATKRTPKRTKRFMASS